MERLWGKSYNRRELEVLYGDLRDNVLVSTLQRGKPHEQVVAIAVLGQQKRKDTASLLAQQLVHQVPLLRYYAVAALESVLGSKAPFDLHQDNARIQAAAQKWLEQSGTWAGTVPATPSAPAPTGGASDED
jgi:hypothetical protein